MFKKGGGELFCSIRFKQFFFSFFCCCSVSFIDIYSRNGGWCWIDFKCVRTRLELKFHSSISEMNLRSVCLEDNIGVRMGPDAMRKELVSP